MDCRVKPDNDNGQLSLLRGEYKEGGSNQVLFNCHPGPTFVIPARQPESRADLARIRSVPTQFPRLSSRAVTRDPE